MSKLRDIQPLVEIADNSLIYLAIIIVTLLVVAWLSYKTFKVKRNDAKIFAIHKLKKIDFSNSKVTAYDFKKYAELLCTTENIEQFTNINQELESYKYKKSVAELNKNLIHKIQDFINV